MIVMGFIPKGLRFIGAKGSTVKAWFTRPTTENASVKTKKLSNFPYAMTGSFWNRGKEVEGNVVVIKNRAGHFKIRNLAKEVAPSLKN